MALYDSNPNSRKNNTLRPNKGLALLRASTWAAGDFFLFYKKFIKIWYISVYTKIKKYNSYGLKKLPKT